MGKGMGKGRFLQSAKVEPVPTSGRVGAGASMRRQLRPGFRKCRRRLTN
jgi:hypothetical protein